MDDDPCVDLYVCFIVVENYLRYTLLIRQACFSPTPNI